MENQDNQQRQDLPLDDSWLDKILEESTPAEDILPDVDISDIDPAAPIESDIEQIIEETLTEIQAANQTSQEVTTDATQVIQQPVVKDSEYCDAFDNSDE